MTKKIIPCILSCLLLLSACVKASDKTSISETAAEEVTVISESSETTAEGSETTLTEADEEEETDPEDMGIYITVTDFEGTEQVLYYLWGNDGEPAFIYMNITDRPKEMMGYASVIARYVAAKKVDLQFGEELEAPVMSTDFKEMTVNYYISEDRTSHVDIAPEEASELLKLIVQAEPEYIHADAETIKYGYDPRYPVSGVYFGGRLGAMSTEIYINFAMYNGRLAAQYVVKDYSELDKLAAKNSATEEELQKAYDATTEARSEWFYADSIDGIDKLYDKLLKIVIKSDKNKLDNVRQFHTDKEERGGDYSGDIADQLCTDRSRLEGYAEVKYRDDITLMLPSGEEPKAVGNFITWKQDNITVFISKSGIRYTDRKEFEEDGKTCEGTFAGEKAYCILGHKDANGDYVDYLHIVGREEDCNVKITFKSSERTEEYDTLCRNIFGSFRLVPYESAESFYGESAPITLCDEPSRFTDEGYALAEAIEYTRTEEAVPKFQAYVPRMLVGGFYALDFRNEYETKFECRIEKLAEDGRWYEVLPVADISETNGSDWHDLYSVFDTGRNTYMVDMSVYPPLPEGRYRLVRPIRRKDSPDKEYGAFMEFDMVNTGERMDISAECANVSYETAPDSISVNISSEILYMQSGYYDIEFFDGEKWSSVRTDSIKVNSIGGSYSLDIVDLAEDGLEHKEFSTKGFDLSRTGKYRLRIDISDAANGLSDNYAVLYAEFQVGMTTL